MVVPMLSRKRSRCVRWRLGWLTGGRPKPCRCCATISKKHVLQCLHSYSHLGISFSTAADLIFFLLNRLPLNSPRSCLTINRWKRLWSILRDLLLELEYLQHPAHVEHDDPNEEDPFLVWLAQLAAPPPPSSLSLSPPMLTVV